MAIPLVQLVRRYESGEIQLPLMQRDYVWTPKKLLGLLDSLYRGWPIGCFYIWQTYKAQVIKAKAPTALVPNDFLGYLLDGQQRLVSLSRATHDPSDGELDFCAYFDLANTCFVTGRQNKTIEKRVLHSDPMLVSLYELIKPELTGPEQHLIHISSLIENVRESSSVPLGREKVEEYRARLTRVAALLDFAVPCEFFKDDHVSNAIELFARLNRGGTKLSAGDVEAAKLSQEATSEVLPLMREFVRDERMRQLGLDFLFVLRALITIHRDNSSFASLPSKWATGTNRDLMESCQAVHKGLAVVIDMIASDLGWVTKRWLPSASALIPVVYYLSRNPGKPTRTERKNLCLFLLRASVRSLFSGAVESSINKYVNAVRRASEEGRLDAMTLCRSIPRHSTRPVTAEQVRNERGMYSPLMQVYLAYLVSRQSASWVSSRPLIDVARGGIKDPLSVHHIFPREFLQKHAVNVTRINCMANYAILAQSDNSALGQGDPRDGYNNLSPDQRKHSTEQLTFQADDRFLTVEAYEEYLNHRSKEIAFRLNGYLGFNS